MIGTVLIVLVVGIYFGWSLGRLVDACRTLWAAIDRGSEWEGVPLTHRPGLLSELLWAFVEPRWAFWRWAHGKGTLGYALCSLLPHAAAIWVVVAAVSLIRVLGGAS